MVIHTDQLNMTSLFIMILLSSFAAWLDVINVLTIVGYEFQASAMEVGFTAIAGLLPHFLFSRHFSAVARRISFKHIMAITLTGRVIASTALIFAPDVTSLIAILFFRSFLIGYMQPAIASYVVQLNSEKNMAAIINLINSSSKIIAPAIGGIFSVTTGEHVAFIVSALMSALALVLLCFIQSEPITRMTVGDSTSLNEKKSVDLYVIPLLLFAAPILFIEGLSNFFSNIIPYAFNFYSIPKITLSLALSSSAVGNISAGLWLATRAKKNSQYPLSKMAAAWAITSLLFLLLTLSLNFGAISLFSIPVIFFALSLARTFYDIHLNGFIYSLNKEQATQLAARRQSLMAISGMSLTITGTAFLERIDTTVLLTTVSISSFCCALIWYGSARLRKQTDVTEPSDTKKAA